MENKESIIKVLNAIMEHELAGVVKYTHYSLMIFGHHRIPIVKWLRDQASESLIHAGTAGEHITSLGGHPSLKIAPLLETHKHEVNDILKESLEHEQLQLNKYKELLSIVDNKHIALEEYARTMVRDEQEHINEVQKMLRKPGELD
ncbi:MAG TPA: ferritin-like domain-containing protein [Oligoflexia bacterium]|nr:ferritin-like domain-containing protein [Oligoflexia bacterium]HMR24383.1 ferritin-like domain-containing protein [Oligoflexia bacterium]